MFETAHLLFPRPIIRPPAPKEWPVVFTLGEKDDAILRAIGTYAYLTIEQLFRLLPSSELRAGRVPSKAKRPEPERYLRTRCLALWEQGLVGRRYLPQAPNVARMDRAPKGKPPLVHWLERKGEDYLKSLDVPYVQPPPARDVASLSYKHLLHHLWSNDLLIAAELLGRSHPELWVADFLPHRALNLQAVAITLPGGSKGTTSPDGWVRFHFGGEDSSDHQAVAFELDNGTEGPKAWRDKLTRLVAYASGPYQQWAGTRSLTVAVVATPGEGREQRLRAWTEAFLRETGKATTFANLFRFAAFLPEEAPPERIYLEPVWHRPFDPAPQSLLELEGGA